MFFIRPANAATILTKREKFTLCESFEVSPSSDVVKNTAGPLTCSYPCSAIVVPSEVFNHHGGFQSELANFLSRPDHVYSHHSPLPAHLRYITALTGVLRAVGRSADVLCVTKHVRDYVGWLRKDEKGVVWRRSSLWLLIRVAIQVSVDRSPLGRAAYKRFMLFFICTLSTHRNNAYLSSDLLHLMSSKVLRRLTKLGSSAPRWLSEMALKTCACLGEIFDARCKQQSARPSPFRNPCPDELTKVTRLSLSNSDEYIRNALVNPAHESVYTPFHPNHHRRGTIKDFLSSNGSFFKEAYCADPGVALYDVERSVEQGIDDWLACVTNVNEACTQLWILLNNYTEETLRPHSSPIDLSIALLTATELYVALDKLVVKEIPMLADYSPGFPIDILETLLLGKTTSLHRLSCAYRYLSMRHSQSRPGWSVLSDEITEDSFPVRYYDQSLHLQELKARIEEDAIKNVTGRNGLVDGAVASRSPLPDTPLQAKVVVFELQCPTCLRIWRSVFDNRDRYEYESMNNDLIGTLIVDVPELQRYLVGHQGPPLFVESHLAYVDEPSQDNPTLRYIIRVNPVLVRRLVIWGFSEWCEYPGNKSLREYFYFSNHTSNDVLAAQVDCPADLTPDEFIAFAHLRSGGSLQWLNILRGLRSRTLNLHREVYGFLTHTTFQVGPLDLNTGAWIWHQELQDSCFCNALLDELDSLFVEVGARSLDGVMMSNISLLLTRLLASSPSKDVSERAMELLRGVRRKTFSWVQELSYDLAMAPTNEERKNLLLDMAAICRSTFDVDPAALPKLAYSAEDVDALLACAFFIHVLGTEGMLSPQLPLPSLPSTFQVIGNLQNCSLTETVDSLSISRRSRRMKFSLIHQTMALTLQLPRFLLVISHVHIDGSSCSVR